MGHGAAGLPLGVQFVGNYDDDARLLLAAEWARRACMGASVTIHSKTEV